MSSTLTLTITLSQIKLVLIYIKKFKKLSFKQLNPTVNVKKIKRELT